MKLHQNSDEYEETATRQAALARDLAERIMGSESMERHERGFIAAILKEWANTLPLTQKRAVGGAPKFCHGSAALAYANYLAHGVTHGDAVDRISDHLEVSRTAIEKAVKANRTEVDEFIEVRRSWDSNTNCK